MCRCFKTVGLATAASGTFAVHRDRDKNKNKNKRRNRPDSAQPVSPLPSWKPRTASRDTDPAVGPSHDPPCASQGQPGCRESPGPQEGLSLGTRAGAGLRERSKHTGTESLPPLGLTPSDIRWGARERCIAEGLDCPVSLQRPPVCSCPPAWEEGGGGSAPGGRSHHLRPGPGTPPG